MQKYVMIEETRKKHSISQAEIAKRLGLSQTQYSRWERGAWEMPCRIVIELSKIFECSTDYLLSIVEEV